MVFFDKKNTGAGFQKTRPVKKSTKTMAQEIEVIIGEPLDRIIIQSDGLIDISADTDKLSPAKKAELQAYLEALP